MENKKSNRIVFVYYARYLRYFHSKNNHLHNLLMPDVVNITEAKVHDRYRLEQYIYETLRH